MALADPDPPFDGQTLKYYFEVAPTYRGAGKEGQSRFLDRFVEKLERRSRVLDVGCGGGIDTAAMLALGLQVDAFDGSPTIAAKTSARLGISVKSMRFEEIDAKQAYDGIWASASLIHVPRQGLSSILGKIFEALKPGGTHMATFKAGGVEGRDSMGRYYNYPTEEELREFYLNSAPWHIENTQRYLGGGYESGNGPWVFIEATRPD
jgi:SAM-dependent methyltransferase